MRNLRRRTVLTAAGATGVSLALPVQLIARAESPPEDPDADTAVLLENIVGRQAGTRRTNASAAVQPKLTGLYGSAKQHLEDLIPAPSDALFPDLRLGTDEDNLSTTFERLLAIAVATAMPVPDDASVPADLSGDAGARGQVIESLRWLYDHHFEDQGTGYYGNWFHWEIGCPTHISLALALLRDDLDAADPDLAAQYIDSMDGYLRSGEDGDIDLGSRFHTGANLVDITTNRIVQGAVLDDVPRITKAVSDQLTAYRVIDPYRLEHGVTDGFYADGSFLMHSSVAYTGSYGVGLLDRATTTLSMLEGTSFAAEGELHERLGGWVATSFGPVITQGWLMEIVKGRSVSRPTSGYRSASAVVESVVSLARHTDAESAARLSAYVAYLGHGTALEIRPDDFTDPADIILLAEMLEDETIEPADIVPEAATFAYNAMDRHVHHRPGFTFALARSSQRVSRYEYMLGENLRPWFQGDGAHHLYLAGDDQRQAYGLDHLTVVDADRLGGVTVPVEERRTIPELYGQPFYDNPEAGFTASSEKQNLYVYFPLGTNTYSGGATLGAYAVAGMQQSDDAAYAAKQAGELPEDFVVHANARSSKSWFMFDEEILVLASGITDEHGRATRTTLDSRMSDPGAAIEISGRTRDGRVVDGTGVVDDPAWLLWTDRGRGASVGYVLHTDQRVDVRLRQVERPPSRIRTANSDAPVAKTVFDLSHTRAADAPAATLAYSLVPGATPAALADHPSHGARILLHSDDVHAVRHPGLGLLALNTFTDAQHEIDDLTVHGPASVIAQEGPRGSTVIAVSDPTFSRETITLRIRGRRPVLDSDPGVDAHAEKGALRVDIRTHQAYGRTFTLTVGGGGIV